MSSGGCHLVAENHGLDYIPRVDCTWNLGLYCRFLLPLLRRDREGSHGNWRACSRSEKWWDNIFDSKTWGSENFFVTDLYWERGESAVLNLQHEDQWEAIACWSGESASVCTSSPNLDPPLPTNTTVYNKTVGRAIQCTGDAPKCHNTNSPANGPRTKTCNLPQSPSC